MGEHKVSKLTNKKQRLKFVQDLLRDIRALEFMLEQKDMFEENITRIGAEQEMVLVDKETFKAAPMAMEALDVLKEYDWVETEIAKFNLETNLDPREFTGNCFSEMEKENRSKLLKIDEEIEKLGLNIVLTGILPTLIKDDLSLENLTPMERYRALIEAINEQLVSESYQLNLKGIDELRIKHDSPLIEACNTSFQVHLQVSPKDFVKMYNIAQALAGPVMAIAANSPLVFGKMLWHESRIAMFQQALDTRTSHDQIRDRRPRVQFGNSWLEDSILDIYREDISRFRVLISADYDENPLEKLKEKVTPKLSRLQVHNGTVYRWNRPCYGISPNGQPHLRIENRVFAAGPTVLDETANAAFWLGLMIGMSLEFDDIRTKIDFEDVHDNFEKAARFGIDCTFNWIDDQKISACDLVLDHLLPIARKGLEHRKIDAKDIDKYLGVIEGRAKKHMNGARWMLKSFLKLSRETSKDEALTTLTSCIIENQKTSLPAHEWKIPELIDLKNYAPKKLKVSSFMDTDLFTVEKEDLIELVAEMMDWKKIKYTPVENKKGHLEGLVSAGLILKHYISTRNNPLKSQRTVNQIMVKKPIVIGPNASIMDAMNIMRQNRIGCLPVVSNKELVGLITEQSILRISSRLLERLE